MLPLMKTCFACPSRTSRQHVPRNGVCDGREDPVQLSQGSSPVIQSSRNPMGERGWKEQGRFLLVVVLFLYFKRTAQSLYYHGGTYMPKKHNMRNCSYSALLFFLSWRERIPFPQSARRLPAQREGKHRAGTATAAARCSGHAGAHGHPPSAQCTHLPRLQQGVLCQP